MLFLNVVFQAEISRFEDPEFEELALRNCLEDPNTRSKLIEELRSLILDRGECNPRRIDDAYCLRFLRCRRFIPALAHRLMVRYEEFRRSSTYLYECDPFSLSKVKNVYSGTLPENPKNGRIILMKFGKWDPDVVPVSDVIRTALIMNEITLQQPKMQILGFTIIVDLEGFSFRHVRHLNTSVAYHMVSLMGVAFPIMIHGLHIINYNRLLYTFFYLFKQFIPTYMWSKIHFHGNSVKSLHRFIDPEYLPPEYEGTCPCIVKFEDWITKIDLYKDEFLVQELRELGYTVK